MLPQLSSVIEFSFLNVFAAYKIKDGRKKWEQLSKRLSALEEERIAETRIEERLRLEPLIEQTKKEQRQIERELERLTGQQDSTDSILNSEDNNLNDEDIAQWSAGPHWISVIPSVKLSYLVFLLFLGAGAFIFSNQTTKQDERAEIIIRQHEIEKLDYDIQALRRKFERLDSSSGLKDEISKEALILAKQLQSAPDEHVVISFKIGKHRGAGYAFMVAASLEDDEHFLKEYITNGIEESEKTLNLINQFNQRAIPGDFVKDMQKWLIKEEIEEESKYVLSILYAIKADKLGDKEAILKVKKYLTAVSVDYIKQHDSKINEPLNLLLIKKE